jgi:hypothetical protein
MVKKLYIDPRDRFGNPRHIQLLMFTAWDSDMGNYTLKEEVWHVFIAALELELKRRNIKRSRKLVPIRVAAQKVWENRGKTYRKGLWRDLSDAINKAFGPFWDGHH